MRGRVFFDGNPWPQGHAVETFIWAGWLQPAGLYFDFHLETANYYAEDVETDEWQDPDEENEGDEWTSKIVWGNYHSCTLSSLDRGSGEGGFLVGTPEQPLDLDKLAEREFLVDPHPEEQEEDELAFGIYLLGHDSVGEHRIRIMPNEISWDGRVALTYMGEGDFLHTFRAKILGAQLEFIRIHPELDPEKAEEHLRKCLVQADRFEYDPAQHRFIPRSAGTPVG